jgi:hypothetical protein
MAVELNNRIVEIFEKVGTVIAGIMTVAVTAAAPTASGCSGYCDCFLSSFVSMAVTE